MSKVPLFISIPHSGEKIPAQTPWLNDLPEEVLMCDVDRYVDLLYEPSLKLLKIPYVKTEWHRFAVDLNRTPEDIDQDSVVGARLPSGTHPRGFHWSITTKLQKILPKPITQQAHKELTELIYVPFHDEVRAHYEAYKTLGYKKIYHIDAHSMPSLGTSQHRDPGEKRADIVVSDVKGTSCSSEFKDLVIKAYEQAGFGVAYNWPYYGGRVTEQYGHPELGQNAIQVELNRSLYMDEKTKKLDQAKSVLVKPKLLNALSFILKKLS